MWETLLRWLGRFKKADIAQHSAVLAYHSLLALVPVVGLVFWYLEFIGISRQWFELVRQFLLTHLEIKAQVPFLRQFNRLTSPEAGHTWGFLGLFLVVYTAWNLLQRFGESLDHVISTSQHGHLLERRGFFSRLGHRALVLLVLPLALAVSLVITQWIRTDSWVRKFTGIQMEAPLFALPLSWIVTILAFFILYYLVPRARISSWEALKAAFLAGPLSELVKKLFGVYSEKAVAMHRIYGVFVVVPLFVLWMQVFWIIILLSALIIQPKNKEA